MFKTSFLRKTRLLHVAARCRGNHCKINIHAENQHLAGFEVASSLSNGSVQYDDSQRQRGFTLLCVVSCHFRGSFFFNFFSFSCIEAKRVFLFLQQKENQYYVHSFKIHARIGRQTIPVILIIHTYIQTCSKDLGHSGLGQKTSNPLFLLYIMM